MQNIIFCALLLAFIGCGRGNMEKSASSEQTKYVNISIENATSNALDWVKLDWTGPRVVGGIIPPSVSKDSLHVPWPITESAKLTFVDDKTRNRFTIELSLKAANELILTGKMSEVVFRIRSYEKAEVEVN